MQPEHIIGLSFLGVGAFFLFATLLLSYICFYKTFYSPKSFEKRNITVIDKSSMIFMQNMDTLDSWKAEVRRLNYKKVSITSFDGLNLVGKYYEIKKGAPIDIIFHGYRGSADRDMNGHLLRSINAGRNVLAVDQRASGESDGYAITFGVNESKDCKSWVDFVVESIDKDAKIVLMGVSMGAATVLTASALDLPKNVVAAICDCGYTSAKEIIMSKMKDMHLAPRFFYPFTALGAKIFGRFNIEENSPFQAMPNAKIPILFIHGTLDDFVPFEMGKRNYTACASKKSFVEFERAGHASSYLLFPDKYLLETEAFLNPILYDEN